MHAHVGGRLGEKPDVIFISSYGTDIATIIRSIVVPATMTLLGRWNWYLPSWLEWLPDVHVEGAEPRRRETGPRAPAQPGPTAP